MTGRNKKPVKPVTKPFLTGSPTDERTVKSALGVFGLMAILMLMTFLVCSAFTMDNDILRIGLNLVVEALALVLFYNNAVSKGTEAVARGEILWGRQEKGLTFAASEKAICFHPAKGYLTALLGVLPILLCAILLAVTAQRQTTGYGALPSWMSTYQQRSEIGDALVAYSVREGIQFTDVLRIIVRIAVMPFIGIVGGENRDGLLMVERLSPLLVLLPVLAYGTGYLQGRTERTRIHTGISESRKSRARKEKRERKARVNQRKEPEQLN